MNDTDQNTKTGAQSPAATADNAAGSEQHHAAELAGAAKTETGLGADTPDATPGEAKGVEGTKDGDTGSESAGVSAEEFERQLAQHQSDVAAGIGQAAAGQPALDTGESAGQHAGLQGAPYVGPAGNVAPGLIGVDMSMAGDECVVGYFRGADKLHAEYMSCAPGSIVAHEDPDFNVVVCAPGHYYEGIIRVGPAKASRAITPTERKLPLSFQLGPVKEAGQNGWTTEALLRVLIDRTVFLNSKEDDKYACHQNRVAIAAMQHALDALEYRTEQRKARGVEGTSAV